jgi:hypothetical protein
MDPYLQQNTAMAMSGGGLIAVRAKTETDSLRE